MPTKKGPKNDTSAAPPERRVPLGKPLPPVKKVTITRKEVDRTVEQRDEIMPEEWRGLLDAKPLGYTGEPAPRFYYDPVKKVNIRASDGHVVTIKEKRELMLILQKAIKGK